MRKKFLTAMAANSRSGIGNLLEKNSGGLVYAAHICACDGIGRHARFRFSCRDACGFESLQAHHRRGRCVVRGGFFIRLKYLKIMTKYYIEYCMFL